MTVALALGGCSAVVTAEATAAGWTTPSVLFDGGDEWTTALAMRADGGLRAAVGDRGRGVALGLADRAPAGHAFASPVTVLRQPAIVAQVAFAADGSGLAVLAGRGRAHRTSVVPFDASGTPQPAVPLDTGADTPTVSVAPDGAAVIAWVTEGASGPEIDAAFRDPGAAAFGAPARAGYAGPGDTLLEAGIGDRGEAVVMWQPNGFPSTVAAAVRQPGQGFGRARYVSRAATGAELAVGPGGQAVIATTIGRRLRVSEKAPGATTMPTVRTLARDGDGFGLDVSAAGDRQLGVAWTAAEKGRPRATRVRVYAGGAGAGGLRRIGTLGVHAADDEDVRIALSPTGAAVVGWEDDVRTKQDDSTGRSRFGVAYRQAGGRFGPTTWMGPAASSDSPVAVAIGVGGRAVAAFSATRRGAIGGPPLYERLYVAERRP